MALTYRRAKGQIDGKDARNHVEPMKERSERIREREGKSSVLLWTRLAPEDILFVVYGE